jgi:endonuclease III related protein
MRAYQEKQFKHSRILFCMMNPFEKIYKELMEMYGPQGWWPLIGFPGNNPTKTGSIRGYHPGDYDLPSSRDQVYQICIGAILTQNTGWISVEKALLNLEKINAISPERLMRLSDKQLTEAIRPAGYFNQKARKLREFTGFFLTLKGRVPDREELLKIWGVGKETADSMLLYAFKVPTFVIDAYTRRIFTNLGYIRENEEYDLVKERFEKSLDKDLIVYQEYHALIVEHAKHCYSRKADQRLCPLFKKHSKKRQEKEMSPSSKRKVYKTRREG